MVVACATTGDPAQAPEPTAEVLSTPPTSGCIGAPGLLVVTGADGEVTVIHPDGTESGELRGPVSPGHPGLQPTWAPICRDGRHLVAWTEAGDDGTFVIAVADALTGEVRRHGSPVAPFYYYWSPDATLLAFLGQNAFSPLQLGMLNLPSGEVEMVDEGQPFYFDWRPDSKAIVTHVDGSLSVLTLGGDGWAPRKIPVRPGLFQSPSWVSPDRILLVAPVSAGAVEVDWGAPRAQGQGDLPEQQLVVSDPDGTSMTLADLEGPAVFSPDPAGNRVAFTDFAGPLRVLHVDQGVSVAVSERKVTAFEWSPDGGRLLFMEVDREAQALAPRVWDGTQTRAFPSFFPTQVFFLQYLPFWDQYSRSLTLWAPDGEAFTYPAAAPDRDRIMVQYLDDRQPTEVAEGVFASWSPSGP